MSQAEDLLTMLSETVPEHQHVMKDADNYFVIDPVTRIIANPIGRPLILMQRDHKSTVYTFQLPRYIDGHDMTLCNRVKCHFNNIETTINEEDGSEVLIEHPDVIELTDLRVNPDDENSVICSWIVTRQATWYSGALGFFLQYLCVDDAGNETYEWHTDNFTDVIVNPTKHNDEAAIIEYTAIFEQWRERIFGAGDSVKNELISLTEEKLSAIDAEGAAQVETIANEGLRVLNTIPEDYTAMSEQVSALTQFAGPVIKQEAEGESIAISDSAKMPLLGLQMFGKSEQKTTNGYNLSSINEITFTQMHRHVLDKPIAAGTYYVSLTAVSTDTDADICVLNFCESDSALIAGVAVTRNTEFKQKIVVPSEATVLNLYASNTYILSENDTATFSNIMITEDENAEYEPYTGGQASPNPEYPQEIESVKNPTTYVYGKNLLDISKSLNENFVETTPGVYKLTRNADSNRFAAKAPIFIPANTTFTVDLKIIECTKKSVSLPFYLIGVSGESYYFTCSEEGLVRSIPEDINYVTFYLASSEEIGTYITFSDVQIEVGKQTNYVYEPYQEVQILTSNIELPGLPVSTGGNYIDKNGQQYIANYRDWERGVDVINCGYVEFTGSEGFQQYSHEAYGVTNAFRRRFNDMIDIKNSPFTHNYKVYSNYFRYGGYVSEHEATGIGMSEACYIYLRFDGEDSPPMTLEELSVWLTEKYESGTPVSVLYPLAKSIETPIPEAELQAYRALRANYPNTIFLNNSEAHMKLAYGTDTKMYIDKKFAELQAAILANS